MLSPSYPTPKNPTAIDNILSSYYTTYTICRICIAYTLPIAVFAVPLCFLYGILTLWLTPCIIPIDIIALLAGISTFMINKTPTSRLNAGLLQIFIAMSLLFPLTIQHEIHTHHPNYMQKSEYLIHQRHIYATPNNIIHNYWSSNALYANIVNTIYDQRSISITLHNPNHQPTTMNIRINNYTNPHDMQHIMEERYST